MLWGQRIHHELERCHGVPASVRHGRHPVVESCDLETSCSRVEGHGQLIAVQHLGGQCGGNVPTLHDMVRVVSTYLVVRAFLGQTLDTILKEQRMFVKIRYSVYAYNEHKMGDRMNKVSAFIVHKLQNKCV